MQAVPRLPIFGYARKSAKLIPNRISKANDAAQAKIGVAEPGSYYSGPALRKTGAISFFAVRIDRCLRGFWRQIKEAPGISLFLGDVRESFGRRLKDSAGETIF